MQGRVLQAPFKREQQVCYQVYNYGVNIVGFLMKLVFEVLCI